MNNKVFFLLFFGLFFTALYSQEATLTAELKQASAITSTSSRLEAYDSILENYGVKQKFVTLDVGKWSVSTKINPIDDSQIVLFILTADSGEGVYGEPIGLIIRCGNKTTEVYINWNSYIGSDAYVTLRVGQEQASRAEWSLSSDSKATFYPGSTVELVKKLQAAEKIVVQCTPYSENPITAIFDVRGLENAAKEYTDILCW